jgi:hypothetical protein
MYTMYQKMLVLRVGLSHGFVVRSRWKRYATSASMPTVQ